MKRERIPFDYYRARVDEVVPVFANPKEEPLCGFVYEYGDVGWAVGLRVPGLISSNMGNHSGEERAFFTNANRSFSKPIGVWVIRAVDTRWAVNVADYLGRNDENRELRLWMELKDRDLAKYWTEFGTGKPFGNEGLLFSGEFDEFEVVKSGLVQAKIEDLATVGFTDDPHIDAWYDSGW